MRVGQGYYAIRAAIDAVRGTNSGLLSGAGNAADCWNYPDFVARADTSVCTPIPLECA